MKRWTIIFLLLALLVPALAQDTTPPAVREGALDAGEAALGVRSDNWRFQVLNATTNSALGCSLVAGEEMPFSVTPYRVELIYPDGIYVVHVSADGRMAQLCDPKFGDAVVNPVAPENACKAAPAATIPAYAAPSTAVPGVFSAANGQQYRIYGVSADGNWLQIGSELGTGWVEGNAVVLSGECSDLLVTAFTALDVRGACFMTPASVMSNVRARPTTDAETVAQIYENSTWQAIARNTAGDWLYMQAGWVSTSVLRTQGDCLNINVSDDLVGAGFASEEALPSSVDTDAARALAVYRCPSDFAGYLPTRISSGSAARVTDGGTPNTVRAFPSLDDTVGVRLGTLQPGTVIDRVINGPACNQGIVWWLVEAGDLTGWTAESNSGSGNYLLEPPDLAPEISDENVWVQNDRPVTALAYTSNGTRLFSAGDEPGFGGTPTGFVTVWDVSTANSIGRINAPTSAAALAYASAADVLAVAAGSGTVTLYAAAELDIPGIAVLADSFRPAEQAPRIAISADAARLAVAACEAEDCSEWRLTLYDTAGGAAIWSVADVGTAQAAAFSPDGTQLALATIDSIYLWDVADGEQQAAYESSGELPITSLAWKPDGSAMLYTGCGVLEGESCVEGRAGLLNAAGELLGVVVTHDSSAVLLAISPNGERFATSDGQEVIERSAVSGAEIRVTVLEAGEATSLVYAPDGLSIAVGTSDGQIVFVASGE